MLEIDYELTIKRSKSISRYQQFQAYADSLNCSNIDKNNISSAPVNAQIAGRSVTHINSSSSKETHLYQNYLNSTKEDRLLQNYVNTTKKTEFLQSHKFRTPGSADKKNGVAQKKTLVNIVVNDFVC